MIEVEKSIESINHAMGIKGKVFNINIEQTPNYASSEQGGMIEMTREIVIKYVVQK